MKKKILPGTRKCRTIYFQVRNGQEITLREKYRRTIRKDDNGEYVFIHGGRHPVIWKRGAAHVEVQRGSVLADL